MKPSTPIHPLQVLQFPLTGSRLIEASAGTGKTFTIAMLYLRLVLGHGSKENAYDGDVLTPPKILVVTFTEAATKELRDRIRSRLAQAALVFREDDNTSPTIDDPLLYQLRNEYDPSLWAQCAHRLETAAEWMDEAAVSTIHAWCYRMLKEHAFSSQGSFNQKLVNQDTELLTDTVRDYWRNVYYPLSEAATQVLFGFWQGPDVLQKEINTLIEQTSFLPKSAVEPRMLLEKKVEEYQNLITHSKQTITSSLIDDFINQVEIARERNQINKRLLNKKNYKTWLEEIALWVQSDALNAPNVTDTARHRLTKTGILETAVSTNSLHEHTLIQTLDELFSFDTQSLKQTLLQHAVHEIHDQFEVTQKARGQFTFNQLLNDLHHALRSEQGEQLAQLIRQQFPVAMIDEFQDTDPTQYAIFNLVYQIAQPHPKTALILIGDPKQAIYSFRGADIYTYLQAREAIKPRLYSLDTNYRSTHNMVNACNAMFNHIEQDPNSQGAFLFKNADDNPVPFLSVKAQGRRQRFVSKHPSSRKALQYYLPEQDDGVELGTTVYRETMSLACARQIAYWLNPASETGFIDETHSNDQQAFSALKPSDIAILVNRATEANEVKKALQQFNIRAVYLSERETIFATPVALEVLTWLQACASPQQPQLLKAALSTASLGLNLNDLEQLNLHEQLWEERVTQFLHYKEIWQTQGVLPMLRMLLNDFTCPQRLLDTAQQGERALTDLLHIAEVLQQASSTLEGEYALIRYLQEAISHVKNSEENEHLKIRLESDASLVKIVTIHKSKGLEYPVVLLPFICSYSTSSKSNYLIWHDADQRRHLSLQPTELIKDIAARERLGEDLRKLYVALTRARYITWIGLANTKDKDSAINYLLGINGETAPHYSTHLTQRLSSNPDIGRADHVDIHTTLCYTEPPSTYTGRARVPTRTRQDRWWIASYTALSVYDSLSPAVIAQHDDTANADQLNEALQSINITDHTAAQEATVKLKGPHRFIRQARAGVFMHEIMEWCQNRGFQQALEQEDALTLFIQQHCQTYSWETWQDLIMAWTTQILTTPLPLFDEKSIRFIDMKKSRAELEFWLGIDNTNTQDLDKLVCTYTLHQRQRPALQANQINGMLKGFIDLIFEHQGKYYVLDYKTNYLGTNDEAYTTSAIEDSILEHRYELQYVIYLYALHRLLRTRIHDYDYDNYIGGAVYCYLRGINAPSAGVHFERPPKELFIELDQLFDRHLTEDN